MNAPRTKPASLPRLIRPTEVAPLYHHLERALREHIADLGLVPGDPVPTEVELQRLFKLSRNTVRHAVDNLVADGILEKRQGSGTFVASPPATYECRSSFTVDALHAGHTPGTRVIDVRTLTAAEPVRSKLELTIAEQLVMLKRLRLLDEEPVMLACAFIPERLVPGLRSHGIPTEGPTQSLYYILEHHYGIELGHGSQETMAVSAPEDVSEILHLEPNTPVIKTCCLLRDRGGSAVIYEEALRAGTQSIQLRTQSTLALGKPPRPSQSGAVGRRSRRQPRP